MILEFENHSNPMQISELDIQTNLKQYEFGKHVDPKHLDSKIIEFHNYVLDPI